MYRKEGYTRTGTPDDLKARIHMRAGMFTFNGPWGLIKWTDALRAAKRLSLEKLTDALRLSPAVLHIWEDFRQDGCSGCYEHVQTESSQLCP